LEDEVALKFLHDPGHGGAGSGGCDHGGLDEPEWVLDFSKGLVLALGGFGCEQRLTRTKDVHLHYMDRAEAGLEWGAKLVFCHHVNAMIRKVQIGTGQDGEPIWREEPDERFDGLMTFAHATQPKALEIGDAICRAAPARLLQRKPRAIPTTRDDWTGRAYNVMRPYVQHGMTAVLIEWGFATSPRDRAVLMDDAARPTLYAAAAAGLARAMELLS
jgi:N-acetylmuramoyl-L-alanine amidase